MEGKTLENQEVANLMKQLENSLFFSGIELKKVTKDKVVEGVPILSYGLNTVIHYAGRQVQPAAPAPATAPSAETVPAQGNATN